MNKVAVIAIPFILSCCLCSAQDVTYQLNGKMIEQATSYQRKKDYLLNPNRALLDISPWKNRFYADISLDVKYKDTTKLVSKFRPTLVSDDNKTSFRNKIDDLYLDQRFQDKFFFYVGKKNVRDGVALGVNPTDFLGENKAVDFTKREEDRRLEREGNYLLGLDVFYKDITWTVVWAPQLEDWQKQKDRILVKASYFLEPLNTDMSLHYFNGDIPGIGLNVSHTVNDNLIVYTESAFRKGSDQKIVKLRNQGSPNDYSVDNRDNSEIFSHIATGGHYTFNNGLNIICEYIYNGSGYNQKEWDQFEGFVTYSYDQFKKGFFLDSVSANLSQANQIMTFRQTRKNYLFTRVSHPSVFSKIDSAVVLFVNLDDSSFLVNPSLDYKINDNSAVALSSNIFVGGKTAEFGMMHWAEDVTLMYKHYF